MAKLATKKVPRPATPTPIAPRALRPLSPSVWTKWAVNTVRRALLSHEHGTFEESALLCDHLRRDDRIFATLDTRVLGALGLPYKTCASEDLPSAADCEAIAKRVDGWWFRCIPPAVLADVLRWVILIGFCVGELVWSEEWIADTRNVGHYELRPRLKIHHPQFVTHDDVRGWQLQTVDGPVAITPGDGRWVLFAQGTERPWMNGAVRALAIPWLVRTFGRRDWSRRSEIDGIGVRKAVTPAENVDKAVLEKFLAQIRNLGAEQTVVLPQGYDLSLYSNTASAADGFSRLVGAQDLSITLVLLGANLPTDAKGGSYALGVVQLGAQLDRLEADVEVVSTTSRYQIVRPWGRFNVEGWVDELAAWPEWDATPPALTKDKATALLTASQALTTLHKLGVDVTPQLEAFGLRARPEGLVGAEDLEPPPPPPVNAPPNEDAAPPKPSPDEDEEEDDDAA